jgi:hypothetical protein
MFQVVLAYVMQADREREIADLNRQRRLLKPETPEPEEPAVRLPATRTSADPCAPRVGARVPGS